MSRNLSWFDASELRHLLQAVGASDRRRSPSPFGDPDVPSTLSGNFVQTDRFSHIAERDPGRFASAASTQPGPPLPPARQEVPFDKKATRFSAGAVQAEPSEARPPRARTVRGTEWGGAAATRLRDQWDVAETASTGIDEGRPSSVAGHEMDPVDEPTSSYGRRAPPAEAPPRRPSTDPPPPPASVRVEALPFHSEQEEVPPPAVAAVEAPAPPEAPALREAPAPPEAPPAAPPPLQLPDGSMEEQLEAFVEWAQTASGFGAAALLDEQGLPLAVGGAWEGDDAFGFAFASTFGRATGLLSEVGRPPEAGHIASTHEAHRFAASWTMVGPRCWWLVLRGDLQAESSRAVAVGEAFHNLIAIMTAAPPPVDGPSDGSP